MATAVLFKFVGVLSAAFNRILRVQCVWSASGQWQGMTVERKADGSAYTVTYVTDLGFTQSVIKIEKVI